mgnify:CR=1 FL=1
MTTGSRIQVESNFSENKCIVIFLTYLLILEQLLIEKRLWGITNFKKNWLYLVLIECYSL